VTVTGTVNVNVTNSTLNVNISDATATLNVNITGSSATLNIYVSDFKSTMTPTALLEKGARVLASGVVNNGTLTIYTVPSGKTAYLITLAYSMYNSSSTTDEVNIIWLVSGGTNYALVRCKVGPKQLVSDVVAGGVVKMLAGDQIVLDAYTNSFVYATLVIAEV
jgi:FlaG/FlaF family flagellin (archaellin)